KDYSEAVIKKRNQLDLFGFKSSKEDAQLIATVINALANEANMTTSRANSILEDTIKLLPLISTI
ncbi:hypothetical protein, partial [Stenotrophomonas maltophilia group sp. RNC7]|uniref:hypothetical protein n=1 Tax=Stenotrophomonas maltophilia group sp. RNC7 TaxID=3071467 RepID=UPI0027E0D206